jgi:hypothetical protein
MLPVAVFAYFAIQVLVSIAREGLPLSDNLQDAISQLFGSIFGPWCFVYSAAKLAPRGKVWPAALSATIIIVAFTITADFLFLRSESPDYALWWIVLTGLVGVGAAGLALWQVSTQANGGRRPTEI